ncbi:hypothetical protein D9M68_689840 [compost metagenome]
MGIGNAPVSGIDVHPETGKFRQDCLLPVAQLVRIGGHVRRIDREQGLLAGEWVGAHALALVEPGRRRGQAARVGRNAAVLVARHLGANRRQGNSQLLRLFRRHRSMEHA